MMFAQNSDVKNDLCLLIPHRRQRIRISP